MLVNIRESRVCVVCVVDNVKNSFLSLTGLKIHFCPRNRLDNRLILGFRNLGAEKVNVLFLWRG